MEDKDRIQAKYGYFTKIKDSNRYLYHGTWSLPNKTKILSYRGGSTTVECSADIFALGLEAAEDICREYGQKHAAYFYRQY